MTVCAGVSLSKTSTPCRSWAGPGVSTKPVGLPSASTVVWILVLSPPRLRPMACFSGSPLLPRHCAGGHAQWWSRSWRIRCPHPAPVSPRHAATCRFCSSANGAYARHGNRQSARAGLAKGYLHGSDRARHPQTGGFFCSGFRLSCLAWQQMLNLCPLGIAEGVSLGHGCTDGGTVADHQPSRELIDDTP